MHKPQPPASGATFDLASIDIELRAEDAYERSGHTARTLIRVGDLRVVLIAIAGGNQIAEHTAEATTALHTVSGHLRVSQGERSFDLPAGNLLVMERGVPHAVEATADSLLLLTLGWTE